MLNSDNIDWYKNKTDKVATSGKLTPKGIARKVKENGTVDTREDVVKG